MKLGEQDMAAIKMISNWRTRAILASIAFVASIGGALAAEKAVDQVSLTFVPGAITINAGDTVRFTNSDRIAHNITIISPDGTSSDEGMDAYKVGIVVKFPDRGTFQVRCRIHPTMKMTVTVK
jgi:plastocyanin